MQPTQTRSPYAHLIIKLFQGPLYAEDKSAWRDLTAWQTALADYFGKAGINLIVSENDGFARIVQPEADENDPAPLPRLMRKQTLNYDASLLCVILREMLEEFDIRSEGTKLFVTEKDIKERIELFFKEQTNKSKLWKKLDALIGTLDKIGILKLTKEDPVNKGNNLYEVKRIIKALVSNDKLEEIKQKMETHGNTVQ